MIPSIRGYVAIGYVFGRLASLLFGKHYRAVLEAENVPKLFVMGERDGFTTLSQLKARVSACAGTTDILVIPSVGHFELETARFDGDLTRAIICWIAKHADCSQS